MSNTPKPMAAEILPDKTSAEDYCITLLRANREAGLLIEPKHVQVILYKLQWEQSLREQTDHVGT